MQEQLFKLYHNERDIETLAEELRVRQKDLDKLVSRATPNALGTWALDEYTVLSYDLNQW